MLDPFQQKKRKKRRGKIGNWKSQAIIKVSPLNRKTEVCVPPTNEDPSHLKMGFPIPPKKSVFLSFPLYFPSYFLPRRIWCLRFVISKEGGGRDG